MCGKTNTLRKFGVVCYTVYISIFFNGSISVYRAVGFVCVSVLTAHWPHMYYMFIVLWLQTLLDVLTQQTGVTCVTVRDIALLQQEDDEQRRLQQLKLMTVPLSAKVFLKWVKSEIYHFVAIAISG